MRKKATILLICFGLGLLLIQIVPAVSGQLPPTPQQPESADLTGPGRLLSEAHALWSKALFDADLIAAQNQCQEALKSYQSAGDLVGQARALNELGLIALKRKRVTEALDFFDQAQNVARTVGDQASAALAIEHRSQAYAAANQLPEALRTGQEALVSYRESRQPQGEARMLIHVGTLHQKLGQSGPAFQSYQQALTTASQIKDEGLVAKALDHLTWAYRSLGQIESALTSATQALAVRRRVEDHLGEGYTLGTLGDLSRQAGQVDSALSLYQQAFALAQQIKAPALEWKMQARLARAHRERGQTGQAALAYEAALQVIESVPVEIMKDPFDQALDLEQEDVFREYADFLLQSERTTINAERAFSLSEQARAYAILGVLAKAGVQFPAGVDPLKLEREQHLWQRLYDLQLALQSSGLAEEERQQLLRQWDQAQDDWAGFKVDMRNVQPRYAAWRYPSVPPIEQLRQQTLTPGTALLAYLLGQERSYLFVLTSEAITTYTLPKAELVEQAVTAYRRFLTTSRTDLSSSLPPDDNQVLALGGQLYETLIRPAQEELRDKDRLIIAPDGWLHYLPFEALIRSDESLGDRRWQYTLESYTISYTPSASVLGWLRASSETQILGERWLMVCDDLTSGEEGRSGAPAREAEARQIEQSLGKQSVDLRLRRRREDPPLTLADVNRYRLLHWVAPVVIDEREPWRSNIQLPLAGEEFGERFLSISAIFQLPLGAQVVTLSHGQPHLGETTRGNGLMSLTRALFYAGTPAVVVSLWDISDPSTGELMTTFYQQVRAGQSQEAALRTAKLQLLRQGAYHHPTYWARFVLIGDGEGTIQASSRAQTVVILSGVLMAVALMVLGISLIKTRQRELIQNPRSEI